jgi:CheY-like chemotaxis protein
MTNAMKFSPEGGRIVVRLRRSGGRLQLEVQDFGQGIPAAFLPHLFDRFTQSDSPGNRRHGGLGLGLSIVKHLVDLHGGEVAATSEGEGRGALMRVELDVEPSGEGAFEAGDTEGGPESEMPGDAVLHGLDVLVVEDDREASELMTLVLADRGIAVRTASDYDTALQAMQQAWPAVLVSDIGLPGRDGYALVRRVREIERERALPHLPVIALTAFGRPEDRHKTLEAGFDVHLGKPIKPHQLLEAIARCCRPGGGT